MSFIQTHTYNPAKEKAVPKDAIVLDLDLPQNAAAWLRHLADSDARTGLGPRQDLVRDIADQIAAQTKPLIEEPQGLGAVVLTEDGRKFVRTAVAPDDDGGHFPWVDAAKPGANSYHWVKWGGLGDTRPVEVLSPGVKA